MCKVKTEMNTKTINHQMTKKCFLNQRIHASFRLINESFENKYLTLFNQCVAFPPTIKNIPHDPFEEDISKVTKARQASKEKRWIQKAAVYDAHGFKEILLLIHLSSSPSYMTLTLPPHFLSCLFLHTCTQRN